MKNSPIKVFILYGCTEQSDFVDSHGEVAGDRETVIGVFHYEGEANAEKNKLEEDDNRCYDYYRISPYVVI